MKEDDYGHWSILPDADLLKIFSYLDVKGLVGVSFVCSSWYRVSNDEFLWKDLFINDWKIDREKFSEPKNGSWKSEYVRLSYHAPSVLVDTLISHIDQVLHISFSHNGDYFSTCSKDSRIKLWRSDKSKAVLENEENMSKYGWNYTQYSQFNSSDTLLMVSGVFTGFMSTSGEIIVFNIIDGFTMQCRVPNKPYDVFGTWYNENYLLAGNIHILEISTSCSSIWLNKAWQETQSERKPVLKRLFKFQNKQYSSIRSLCVAKCLSLPKKPQRIKQSDIPSSSTSAQNKETPLSFPSKTDDAAVQNENVPTLSASILQGPNNDLQLPPVNQIVAPAEEPSSDLEMDNQEGDEERAEEINHLEMSDYSSGADLSDYSDIDDCDHDVVYYVRNNPTPRNQSSDDEYDEFVDSETKLLIFTCGSETYTPHRIGFKKIQPFKFDNTMNRVDIANRLREKNSRPSANMLEDYFDTLDAVIDFRGHIIGMALAPDERYLYINCRSWPEGAEITDPLRPPPIAQEIEIHIVDLLTLEKVGKIFGTHKAYTPNDDCFFIFLDVCQDYVASGAEDKNAYLWDRHYSVLLNSFGHDDVVNCVAFDPKDSEKLLSVSDDATIKVWMSRNRAKEYRIDLESTNMAPS